jgi:hypothetical protein
MAAVADAVLILPARFNGPPHSAHGGYFAGRLAACLQPVSERDAPPAVTVTLRKPPPLEEPMDLLRADAPVTLAARIGDVLIAEAGLFCGGLTRSSRSASSRPGRLRSTTAA